jgi:hypothetical protein
LLVQPPRRKHAAVTLKDGAILVESISYSGMLGVSNGPFCWLDERTDNTTLGRTVREAMIASRGLPLDFDVCSKEFETSVFSETKYRGWSDFQRRARRISVTESEGQLAFTPMHNRGARRNGFVPIPSEVIYRPNSLDAEDVGIAIREALGKCS